ncbi:hypothetical protein BpHYR1_015912 [Brachionus plicatilis]|uniref:Uncharacterized protein n=1 Tax=Brachionus plicatilis TaxID=10195 RepID=A0A3M7P4A9_BRAPC|nr:hypothetical protein BpHYR1_015912 [Brachionus plicatilis]
MLRRVNILHHIGKACTNLHKKDPKIQFSVTQMDDMISEDEVLRFGLRHKTRRIKRRLDKIPIETSTRPILTIKVRNSFDSSFV